jgi:diguanylate cyclase (GGDEF)-like protein
MTLPQDMRQLTEYLTAIGAARDEPTTVAIAVRLVANVLSGDVAAAVVDGAVRACHGLGDGVAPIGMVKAADTRSDQLVLDGFGHMHLAVADLGDALAGQLLAGRRGQEFSPEERGLLAAMAQTLGLAVRGLRALATERSLQAERDRDSDERIRLLNALGTRQRLLETLLGVQRAISAGRPLQGILDTATAGAAGLLDHTEVILALTNEATGELSVASVGGPSGGCEDPFVLAAVAEARDAGCLITRTGGGTEVSRVGLGSAVRSVLAAPVSVRGAVAGVLAMDTFGAPGQVIEQRELLTAFAQQVSLALADARAAVAAYEANHDNTTGLPNRAHFLDRLRRAIELGGERVTEVTALVIDLDRFQTINDGIGHRGGDAVLAEVAERIRTHLRSGDLVARLGGDEFGVLITGAGSGVGARVAESVLAAIRKPFRVAGRTVSLTASAGVATSGVSSADAGDLVTNADVALSRAKRAGCGQIVIFEPYMHAEILERLRLLDDLQRALRHAQVRLQYQPLIQLDTGRPVGVEALARWRHPQRGNVSPAAFIPLAEETGLIVELGLLVLQEGCRQVSQWRMTAPDMGLNVNVSARQAMHSEFVSDVEKALAGVGLPAEKLTLELTESVLMGDPDASVRRLGDIKDLGVRLSIDDFGTGYSSLSYLRRFPVDQLKIDRQFVAGITECDDQLAVTRTVMELGRTLRLETVAEGIEDVNQVDTLRQLGCDLGQGFHLGRPMEPEAVTSFFATRP